ncbi:hypothetical protein PGT21_000064 [Puccinia graminis f. sp. tritici]|uniref:Uncharacterized protein n=1 Tax=Puccinia graminis f. sp. tritici TaxID=56615 RepID=A0A5B0LQT1_PUCGR|nr:hypothetical protein PGT21_000064 [Puccinia graminis f. sp. tritici]
MSNSRAFALDESSAINFKPYDSSNHKAQLVDFIRLVDNHAIIPPKSRLTLCVNLANKYLNILTSLTPSPRGRSNSRPDAASITSKNSIYRCCSITSKNSIYSQAISGKISITGKGLCGSIHQPKPPSRSSKRSAARASVSPSPKQSTTPPPITRKIYSWPITSQTISTIKIYSWPITSQTQTIKAIKTERKPTSPPRRRRSSFPVPRRAHRSPPDTVITLLQIIKIHHNPKISQYLKSPPKRIFRILPNSLGLSVVRLRITDLLHNAGKRRRQFRGDLWLRLHRQEPEPSRVKKHSLAQAGSLSLEASKSTIDVDQSGTDDTSDHGISVSHTFWPSTTTITGLPGS